MVYAESPGINRFESESEMKSPSGSVINERLDELSGAVSDLEELTMLLIKKIDPVMRDSEEKSDGSLSVASNVRAESNLAHRIYAQRDRLKGLQYKVGDAIERLEL